MSRGRCTSCSKSPSSKTHRESGYYHQAGEVGRTVKIYYSMRKSHAKGVLRVKSDHKKVKFDESTILAELDNLVCDVGKGIISY